MLHVFIPTDFSRNSKNAIRYALKFARRIDCRFTFLHAGILPMPVGEVPILVNNIDTDTMIAKMKTDLNKIAADNKIKLSDKRISFIAKEDFNLSSIIEQKATEVKADLIVMGTRGASGIKKALIGSNTVDVISGCSIPVLAVPENYIYKSIRKITMPSDLNDLDRELKEALPFAKIFNAGMEILFLSDATEMAMKKFDQATKLIAKNSYKKIKLKIQGETFGQSIAKDIEQSIKRSKPDLVIMFRHKHNWLGNLFLTSQTDKLVFASKLPLLALREPE